VLCCDQVPLGQFYCRHSALLGGAERVGQHVWVDWGMHNAEKRGKYPYGWYEGKLTSYQRQSGEYEVSFWVGGRVGSRERLDRVESGAHMTVTFIYSSQDPHGNHYPGCASLYSGIHTVL